MSLSALQESLRQSEARCAQLQAVLQQANAQLEEKQSRIDALEEQLALLRAKRYGRQSEQLSALQGQLFDEAELEQSIRETEQALAAAKGERRQRPAGDSQAAPAKRRALPAHLKRIEIVIDVADEEKRRMGEDWVLIGYDTSEQLAVQERQYFVKHYKRAKYVPKAPAAPSEDALAPSQGIVVAPRPNVILPKTLADASLLAQVITHKFVDALSFYRTINILRREGIDIGYSTLCDWPIQLAERLAPLRGLLLEYAQSARRWHLDETTLQVLDEPGRANHQKSYLWALRAGPPGQEVMLFHYDERRSFEALDDWLSAYIKPFRGVIVTDEHGAYNRFAKVHSGILAHGGCWAHARRRFADAIKGRRDVSDAHAILKKIAELYQREASVEQLEGEAKVQARHAKVKPVLEQIHRAATDMAGRYLNQGLMGEALRYLLNHWDKLTRFLDYADLPLDNNPIEQAIRPFTVGRRNWLFSGSPRGAHASALMYSLVQTAKLNGWEPKHYLQTLFERYPDANNDEQRRALLPMFLKPDA